MSFESFSLVPNFNDDIFNNRFKQIDKIFSTLTGEEPLSNVPHYNIIQKGDSYYQLVISLPGYKKDELEISLRKNELNICSKKKFNTTDESNIKFLHKGIKDSNFSLNFNLNRHVTIKKTQLSEGLLKLDFIYENLEEEKAKRIAIDV